jgi:aspartate oxidase
VRQAPNLVVTKEWVAEQTAKATVDALRKQLAKRSAKQAKAAREKLKKSAPVDVGVLRQRAKIASLQERFEKSTNLQEKAVISQELAYERLRFLHAQGRI